MSFEKKPSPPLGNTTEAVWHRQLLRWLDGLMLHDVIGGKKIGHPAGGYSIQVDPARGGGARVSSFRLDAVFDDYLTGYRVTGVDVDGNYTFATEVSFIAKKWKLRNSITEETILGVTFSYEYTDFVTRISTSDEGTPTVETQLVTPPYLVTDDPSATNIVDVVAGENFGDLIEAALMPGGTGVTADIVDVGPTVLTWQELGERAWGWKEDA